MGRAIRSWFEKIKSFLIETSQYLFRETVTMLTALLHFIAHFPFISALIVVLFAVAKFLAWAKSTGWHGEWFQIWIWVQSHVVVLGLFYCAVVILLIGLGETYRSRVPESKKPPITLRRKQLMFVGGLTFIVGFLLMGVMSLGSQTHASHGCADAVSITTNTSWTTNQCHGAVTVTNGATLTISGNTSHTLTSLTLGDATTNGFITAQGDTVNGVGVTITTDSDIEIKSGSSISANNQGYNNNTGPGTGSTGAGYGGMGGGLSGGATYGSMTAPISLGSGGDSKGGGAVKLNIAGNFINNGAINSSGSGGFASGSGGSIWVNFTGGASAWSGSGTIAAGSTNQGAGGRIAVTGYVTDTHSGTTTAFGGGGFSQTYYAAAAGTVYLKSSSQTNGVLVVDNNNVTVGTTPAKYTKSDITNLTLDELKVQNNGQYIIPSGSSLTLPSGANMTGGSTGVTHNEGTLTLSGTHSLAHILLQKATLTASGSTLTIASGGTLRTEVATTLNNVTVQSGGDIDHPTNTTAETYKVDLTVTDLTVNSGGTINVNNLGYDNNTGPGGSASGASYGGIGGGSVDTYGSATAPTNIGSGGDSKGGGAMKLTIGGNLVNNGTISSNGGGGFASGSGGSIWINFTGGSSAWSGAGTIAATSSNNGSGGRIAVTGYVTDTHSSTVLASTSSSSAANGTVYLKSSSQTYGVLVIDNNSGTVGSGKYAKTNITNLTLDEVRVQNRGAFLVPSGSSVTLASSGTYTVGTNGLLTNQGTITLPSGVNLSGTSTGTTQNEATFTLGGASYTLSHILVQRGSISNVNMTIASGGTLRVDTALTLGTVTVQSGGDIDHSDNTTAETYKMDLTVTDLTVNTGGTINVNNLGYNNNTGPGGSTSGASYGGLGGGLVETYGSLTAPTNIGSGGDSKGGGAIKLTISGNLVNNGAISSQGSGGFNSGSGGSVWINFTGGASAWSGSGTIAAYSSNNGGGGRVAVTGYVTDTHSSTVLAGGGSGGPGTVYLKSSTQTNGVLVIDNNNATPTAGRYAKTNVTNLTVDQLKVQNRGAYLIPSGSQLTVDSAGSITHSANSTVVNRGTFTSTGITHTISGTYAADGTTNFGTVTVASGGTINHSDNTTAETYKATITAAALTVSTGGLVDINSLGYDGGAVDTAGSGAGAGALGGSLSAGGGGGYGGAGGTGGGASGGAGGSTYGSTSAPTNIGSGGGGGDSAAGGAGGGAVKITTTGNLTVAGTIRANGAAGSSGTYGGAGGSGGSIWLIVGGNFNCTGGVVTANGGNGAGSTQVGGGGGGGRLVRNVTGTYTACTTYTASAGTGGTGAGAGTTYVPATTPTGLSAGSITASSMSWSVTDASTTETTFRLYNASDDSLITSTASTTTGGTGSSYSLSDSGLSPNTQYTRYATAYDGTADSAPTSSVPARTLANVPGAPTVNGTSTSSLTVIMDVNSNPASTEFAIYETGTTKYVQADGTLNTSPAWQTYTTWGGASGQVVTGLSVNTAYTFQVKARNADNTETALSSSGTKYTLANAPGTPTGSAASATSVTVIIAANSNPAATEFSIFNDTTDTYAQTDGTLGASAAWQTLANWGGASGTTITGLDPNTSYSFTTKARNGNNTETSASDGVTLVTNAAVPAIASVEPVSDTAIRIKLSVNGNPASTEFAIYNATVGSYVAADGTLTSSPIWQTYTNWGGSTGVVNTGLTASATYDYQAKARNSLGVQTSFSAVLNTSTAVAPSTPISGTDPTPTPTPVTKGKKPTPTPLPTASPSPTPSPTPDVILPPQCQAPGILQKILNFLMGKKSVDCHPQITPSPSPTPICLLFCDVTLGISMTPAAGTYDKPIDVTIAYTPTDHDANIYYTLDSTAPSALSILYRNPIYLEKDATVAAKAIGSESPTISQSYTITSSSSGTPPSGEPPVSDTTSVAITPAGGEYSGDLLVTIAGSGPVTDLLYTADGSDPRVDGLPYYGPITVSQSSVITAVAKDAEGNYSELAREEYHFTNYTQTIIVDWEPITKISVSPSPTTSSSPEATATPLVTDVAYDVLCNGEKVTQTHDTTYSDATERLDGCHYDVIGKTDNGDDLGPIEDLVITRVAGASSRATGVPYQAIINLMLITTFGILLYALIAWLKNGWSKVLWQLTVLWLGLLAIIYKRNRRITLAGVVRDQATKQPIKYALIKVVATSGKVLARGVASANGRFKLSISEPGDTLIVTHPSYRMMRVTLPPAGNLGTIEVYGERQSAEQVHTIQTRIMYWALLSMGGVMSILLFLNQVTVGLAIVVAGFVLMATIELLFTPKQS